jgi:hypothetical protein
MLFRVIFIVILIRRDLGFALGQVWVLVDEGEAKKLDHRMLVRGFFGPFSKTFGSLPWNN